MTARITDTKTFTSYIVHCAADCRGVDRHAYEMACMLGDVVRMGTVIVELL